MRSAVTLPLGDPGKGYWTYADIAAHVVLTEAVMKKRMRSEWRGFPEPLPYSKRELRWRPSSVLAFFERFETARGARVPQFHLIQGGRAGA